MTLMRQLHSNDGDSKPGRDHKKRGGVGSAAVRRKPFSFRPSVAAAPPKARLVKVRILVAGWALEDVYELGPALWLDRAAVESANLARACSSASARNRPDLIPDVRADEAETAGVPD